MSLQMASKGSSLSSSFMAKLAYRRHLQKRGSPYSNEITVAFNDTAYNNEDLFETWIDEEYCPILTGHDNLLVMDVATSGSSDRNC